MEKNLPNLQALQFQKKGSFFFGGSQQMYPSFLRRRSGCGPTTASNLFLYLHLVHPTLAGLTTPTPSRTDSATSSTSPSTKTTIEYDDVLTVMNTLWNYITPGMSGVQTTNAFVTGAMKYLAERNSTLLPVTLDIACAPAQRPSLEAVRQFLCQRLSSNIPVAFLNLHQGALKNLPGWHWVLLVGIRQEGATLFATIYDEGVKKEIDLSLWLDSTRKGGGFASFAYNETEHTA